MLRNGLRQFSSSSSSIDDWLKTGMTIEFLGTGSARPTKCRNVSSLIVHHSSGSFLFDCGDGTLRQLLCSELARPSRIEAVFITHLHCDHFYGLPAVAVALAEGPGHDRAEGRSSMTVKKKQVFSPKGLSRLMGTMLERHMEIVEVGGGRGKDTGQHIDSTLPFSRHILYENEEVQIGAMFIRHSISCLGYILRERPRRKLDVDRLTHEYQLPPGPLYRRLQAMECVISPSTGHVIEPQQVVSEVPGRTVVILGDTCDPRSVAPYAQRCDALVHEATGVEADKVQMLQSAHSTGSMAGAFAMSIGTRLLLLNHFSPRQVIAGVPCDEAAYQDRVLKEAKAAAGRSVLVVAAHDHLAIPIPRVSGESILREILPNI